jgi:hypothetical protein
MNLKLGWLVVSAITVLALFAGAPPTLASVRTHVVTMDGPVPAPSPRVAAKDGPVPAPSPRVAAKDGPVPAPSPRRG